MRFLLPVAALCLVASSAPCLAEEKNAVSPTNAPTKGKTVNKDFFLEEVPEKDAVKSVTDAAKKNGAKPEELTALKNKIQGEKINSHFQSALIFQSMNITEKAIEEYELALKEDPNFVSTYNNLAQCLINHNAKGDKERAQDLLNRAMKLEPSNVGTMHALAVLKESNKDSAGAEEIYSKIIKIQPLNISAIRNLSEMYYRIGQKDKARQVILEAMKQNPPEQQALIFKEALANLDGKKPAAKPAVKKETRSVAVKAPKKSVSKKVSIK